MSRKIRIIVTALVVLAFLPMGYAARRYPSMGGEWLTIAATFTVAYAAIISTSERGATASRNGARRKQGGR